MAIKSFSSLAALSNAAAQLVAALAGKAIAERGRFTLALSGGNTPKMLYATLARDYKEKIDWDHVHLFWGDERHVPHDDMESNFRMVKESLLGKIEIPMENIHSIPTSLDNPQEAAVSYATELASFFNQPIPEFDLILLGLGGDGHTASIFPRTPIAKTREGLVIVTQSPIPPAVRISLTMNVLDNARNVLFLVAGKEKKEILKAVLVDEGNANSKYPAARVKPQGELVWFVEDGGK